VAARAAQAGGRVKRVLLLDCDVHQGDGSAEIFSNDPSVFTFSIHGAKNYPFNKVPGDLDLALPDGTGDQEYLELLKEGTGRALALANPDLVIYLSGADPFHGDAFGRLALTKAGLRERDHWVLSTLAQAGLPTTIVMGGGYAPSIEDIVDIHLGTIAAAVETNAALRT
jgi:acetoin utilization deacetylase AcuC-like enzyme